MPMLEISFIRCDIFSDQELFNKMYVQMPKQRQEKISFYRYEKDRCLSLGTGILLKYGFKRHGLSGQETQLYYNEYGKPYLTKSDLYFNVSHSEEYAVCAFSNVEVGVDIEKIKEVEPELIRAVCSDNEYKKLVSIPDDQTQQREFFRIWTAKESFLKCIGTGISKDPQKLEITFDKQLEIKQNLNNSHFCLKEYASIEGYCLTICHTDICGAK